MPCGCQKVNRGIVNPQRIELPAGYKLIRQGQRDAGTQVILARNGSDWSTWLLISGVLSHEQFFDWENQARHDFDLRMKPEK